MEKARTPEERSILKKILHYMQVKHEKYHILRTIDIDLNFEEDSMVPEIMFNIIGFPSDNTLKYSDQFRKIDAGEDADFENMFCADWLTDTLYNYLEGDSTFKNDDEMIDWLYKEYDKYMTDSGEEH